MINKATLARIHVAKSQLGLDDDTYRTMLRSVAGVDSARNLSPGGATAVLKHLERSGFQPTTPSRRPPAAPSARVTGGSQAEKIRALWHELHSRGAVRNVGDAALAAYVKRQTGADAVQWLSTAQASNVIESLKRWLARTPLKQVQS
ncbi:regulatory protein GemA [Burkholderia sp. Ac-20345]|uniref:gp16 family protein n=1 Tax=Burkholderia sp. Ac-20345 TaxID=2703891 RepID=UPI00197C53E2|nr:regulatory protein GemA [Burkholderia sp. Ac-20345]MBN3779943.1 regulatory protein GemA [Burkholderia sp. Ac-20345]